ncbi:CRAL-TRIO domain-containing protein [Lineolata rhizophorae]|uniref:CRAL-TRIO domain-containing protein n=1 Tax=Lineolata rhizophorae TaxID=578093 RepID=A0A6A6NPF7_9PEZI|nr:CRAL-TRIO domain-containing protein [Lineolata rhizophorae]
MATTADPQQPVAAAQPSEKSAALSSNPPGITGPTGPRKTPVAHPHPSSKPRAPPRPLTADESAKYDQVLSTVSQWTTVPTSTARGAPTEPITGGERMWLTRECILRYLRATKWNAPEAARRLQATLAWRREFGVDALTPEGVSRENETGKQVLFGFDTDGRPCLYLNPARQNTDEWKGQLQHLVYMLERVIDVMPPGQETLALVISYGGTSRGKSGPGLAGGKEVLGILQGHYPERLGRALITELPWFISTFYKLIRPFIDPITRDKMHFNEALSSHIPPEQLIASHGGEVDFEYDHQEYWPALTELAKQRREEMRARWEKDGKKVGASEWMLRGGEVEEGGKNEEVGNVEEKIGELKVEDKKEEPKEDEKKEEPKEASTESTTSANAEMKA